MNSQIADHIYLLFFHLAQQYVTRITVLCTLYTRKKLHIFSYSDNAGGGGGKAGKISIVKCCIRLSVMSVLFLIKQPHLNYYSIQYYSTLCGPTLFYKICKMKASVVVQ